MKKNYNKFAVACVAMMLLAMQSWGQTASERHCWSKAAKPFLKANASAGGLKTPAKTDEIPTLTVVDEDFSKWTAGTEDAPDAQMLGGSSVSYKLSTDYMNMPGWTGNQVYQAGGACAIRMYEGEYGYSGGFISTPEMELFGEVTLTFRAKRLKDRQGEGNLWVALCDNTSGPEDSKDFILTDEWQEYSMESTRGTFNARNIFQFSAEDGDVLVDDIKITRRRTKIASPDANPAINHSPTEFTASWFPTSDAKSYLLSVYYKDMPEDAIEPHTVTETFDGINLNADGVTINTENPGYPDGWTIDVSTNGSRDVSTAEGEYSTAPQALVFDEVGDMIVTPVTPAPINTFSFWVKPSSMELETDWTYSIIAVSVYTEAYGWTPIANIYNQWMTQDGAPYMFGSEAIGEGVTQVKIEFIQKNSVTFAIDDFTYTYGSQTVPYPLITDLEVVDTFYTVKDIDPSKEHFYYVKAKDGAVTSDPSYSIWVDGINGVKPVVKEATDVTTTGFTANWEKLYNADSYKLNVYQIKEAAEAESDVVVLYETFDGITDGTLESPQYSYDRTKDLAADGMTDTEWMMQLPLWAEGMAGAQATNAWMGWAGLVLSPRVTLNCNGGDFSVDFKAYNTYPGDSIFVMILKDYTDAVALDARLVPMSKDEPGMISASVRFEGGTMDESLRNNIKIAFMSYFGEPFFIDEVTVRQSMKAGERMAMPYKTEYPEQNSCVVKELPSGMDYAYEVTAMRTKNYVNYVSEISDLMEVKMGGSSDVSLTEKNGVSVRTSPGMIHVCAEDGNLVTVYDLQGRTVCNAKASAGETGISVPPSVYIVKCAGSRFKVVVP